MFAIDACLCDSCGACPGVCFFDAIVPPDGSDDGLVAYHIVVDACVDCGVCVGYCPQGAIVELEEKESIRGMPKARAGKIAGNIAAGMTFSFATVAALRRLLEQSEIELLSPEEIRDEYDIPDEVTGEKFTSFLLHVTKVQAMAMASPQCVGSCFQCVVADAISGSCPKGLV